MANEAMAQKMAKRYGVPYRATTWGSFPYTHVGHGVDGAPVFVEVDRGGSIINWSVRDGDGERLVYGEERAAWHGGNSERARAQVLRSLSYLGLVEAA